MPLAALLLLLSHTVFDAAWSLACQRSGLHFSDGPRTMLDKGRHLALPLRFWEEAIGRNPRTLRSWLRVLACPTRSFPTGAVSGLSPADRRAQRTHDSLRR
jgi:hypothetical protein